VRGEGRRGTKGLALVWYQLKGREEENWMKEFKWTHIF